MSLSQPDSTSVENTTCTSGTSETLYMVANRVEHAGMSGPAAVLLHTFKPLAWVVGQLAWVFQPFADGLNMGRRSSDSPVSLAGLARLLESENGVNELLERLRTPKERDR